MAIIKINAGGGTYTDGAGNIWSADQYFTNGQTYATSAAIDNTVADSLYQNERYGKNLGYAIALANGEYTVNLKFAEIYWTSAGKRVFDVSAEGQLFFDDLDIYAQAGGTNIALDKSLTVNVQDGVLNLNFDATIDNGQVTAIEIIPVSTTTTPGVTLTQTGGSTAVTEGGATDTYSIVLKQAPTADVTITLNTGNQVSVDKAAVTFTPTNWNTAQTVTVTAVDDLTVEGAITANITHTVTSQDTTYNNLTVASIPVTITDNDTPVVAPGVIRINAGGGTYTDGAGNTWSADQSFTSSQTYFTTAAIGNTTDDSLYQNERFGKNLGYAIALANGEYTVNLKFAEIYWTSSGKRVFDVSAEGQLFFDDLDIYTQAGGTNIALDKSLTVNVTDGVLNLDFAATLDNGQVTAIEIIPVSTAVTPGVTLTQTGGSTAVTEGGAIDTYSIVLKQAPTADVTITLNTGNQVSVDKPTVTFTPTNWNTAQTVIVTAVDDLTVEGAITANITHTVTSQDTTYNNLTVASIPVTITDNDAPVVAPGTIRINAGGGSYTDTSGNIWSADQYFKNGTTYSTSGSIAKTENDGLYQDERSAVNLAYEIPVANGNYTVNLHFSEIYWNDFGKRVFDVSIENEKFANNLDIFALSKNAFFPGKESALVMSAPQVNVSDGILNLDFLASIDNAQIAGIEVIPLTGPSVIVHQTNGFTTVAEGGAADSYDIVLNQKPTADVTITIATNSDQLSLNKTSLTFTPDNWNTAQVVTVNAVDDPFEEGTQTFTINHTVSSADSNYNNLSVVNVPVNVTDNDVVNIDFSKKNVADFSLPTTAAWGPDGRLYVGNYFGEIKAYTFDDNYNVIATQTITTLKGLSNNSILGIAFNPYDTSDSPSIYVSHSQLYANGGAAFPQTELSPYSGQVSILEGPDFSTIKPLITGLPVSNHDHGINGMDFDNQGNLYIAVGGNTNAGVPNSNIGGIPESPYTAAILKAEITKGASFNGKVEYQLPSNFTPPQGLTFDPATSQVFGDVASVKPGVDVSVYASGTRNPYDLTWTTTGKLYATDNAHNPGFGSISTSATTEIPAYGAPDELNLIVEGAYYGHPNRNRGQEDPRQNVYYDGASSIPGVYTAPLATVSSSTNGITEYRATTFNNQLRGNLLAQQWNGTLYNFTLSPDGTQVQKQEVLTAADGLDVLTGPGGVIVGIDLAENAVSVATPNDPSVGNNLIAYDISTWRAPAAGGNQFTIGGENFGNLSNTTVTIGGQVAQISSVSSKRIMGTLPAFTNPQPDDLLDVVVTSGGKSSVIPDAFLPLTGSAYFI